MKNPRTSRTPPRGKGSAARQTRSARIKAPDGEKRAENRKRFPIVGVGASAGGLEAFSELLRHLPTDTGMAFVLVQHLAPAHESELTQLLSRTTKMPTLEVTNNLRVAPNHVYVIPPNTHMAIAKGVLKLSTREAGLGAAHSIDFFFESLARDQREFAIGVILSGTATDGTLGLEAIKAEDGITFAQDHTAKYDSMPRSAIASGCVDLMLSPEGIARELAEIARHPYVAGRSLIRAGAPEAEARTKPEERRARSLEVRGKRSGREGEAEGIEPTPGAGEDRFNAILTLLRNYSGVDFSLYKTSTIHRRITRRMVLNRMTSLVDYAAFLRGNRKEIEALYSDLLINVTSFFRNPEAFEILKEKVMPKLLEPAGGEPVRVWVLGCSTGQEAYSLAMILEECVEKLPRKPKAQIFATDLNEALLEKARAGLYAKSIVQGVSPERLRRFFTEEEGGYRVSKMLRDTVVFAKQNLMTDPPFSRMDLISCRNVLIYLEPSLQKRLIPTLHYALKPSGFLLLGASESISGYHELFEPIDKKHKIYAKKPAAAPAIHLQFAPRHPAEKKEIPGPKKALTPEGLHAEINAQREADRVALNRYVPPSVLVNADLQVLHFRGDTSPYLKPPTGKPRFHLLQMAREGLMLPLRSAFKKARQEGKTVRRDGILVRQNGRSHRANIEIIPLKNLKERCFLVFFEDSELAAAGTILRRPPEPPPQEPKRSGSRETRQRISELERELAETRDYLQSVQEQYEAVNEELQASNEEVTSANEELQSINEELETSKEELESTNEELTTVNEEMANRNLELGRLNSDLNNLFANVHVAVVLLGRDLAIRRFTAPAEKLFNLVPADVGRPITRVRGNLESLDIGALLSEVIDTVSARECEVRGTDGRWYAVRARPYLSLENRIDGAVLVVMDIDAIKRREQESKEAREYSEAIFHAAPVSLLVLRPDLTVESANESFYKTFKTSAEETLGRKFHELGNGQWNIPRLRQFLEEIIPRNSFFTDFEVTHDFPAIGRRTMSLAGRPLQMGPGKQSVILLSIEDFTGRLEAEAAVRRSETRFRGLFEAARDGILILDSVSRKITDSNPSARGVIKSG